MCHEASVLGLHEQGLKATETTSMFVLLGHLQPARLLSLIFIMYENQILETPFLSLKVWGIYVYIQMRLIKKKKKNKASQGTKRPGGNQDTQKIQETWGARGPERPRETKGLENQAM